MKVLGLLSGKGGVGKTSSAINLAAALNHFGKDTIVLDGNLTTPNVGVHLGLPVSANIHNVLNGQADIHQTLQQHPRGFQFIPGSLSLNDMESLKLSRMKQVQDLNTDYLILDGAAGLGAEVLTVMEHADELLIVTNPELPAVTDALKTVRLAEELGKKVKGVIVTRAKNDKFDVSIRNIEAIIEHPVIGVIPEDNSMRAALSQKDAVVHTHPNAPASQGYFRLAAGLADIQYIPKLERSWLQSVMHFIRGH